MRADHQRSEVSPPGASGTPSATPHGAADGGSVFPEQGLVSQLLESLHQMEKASRAVRHAIARYCDVTDKAGGEPYLRAIDLSSQVEELVNRAIEDVEARTLAKVQR